MAKRGLIITADDMGYNVERNQGIIECFEKGGITNSSLMVNGVACEDAVKLALKYGLPTGGWGSGRPRSASHWKGTKQSIQQFFIQFCFG